MIDLSEYASRLRGKKNEYIKGGEFSRDLPPMTSVAESQLVSKLSVGNIRISATAWRKLSPDTRRTVARELGSGLQNVWLTRYVDGTCVAILGEDYTIIDHAMVTDAVAACGIPCVSAYPSAPDVETSVVFFRLVDESKKYDIGKGQEGYLSVLVRNSEIGMSALGADIGIVFGDAYMWAQAAISVSTHIRHYHNDAQKVAEVIKEILAEAPEIAGMHSDLIRETRQLPFFNWDSLNNAFPKYVIEQVEAANPKTAGDVYLAICKALRDVENEEYRRQMERMALQVSIDGKVVDAAQPKDVTVGVVCPLCGSQT